ncbi:sigma-54-dependent Fis family transcriptional regulator [Cupriavidus oxalaticus]|uniref:Sigma 54-interacting transcriptional regulator n=1 Tax=Cupriavidus oxalaticus TaxID=96344 RepID=A0A375FU24_9BURK|nr:sigma-54-dependent Fis family transcriptional regulator [Cupriavidus oxalaticus]QRQ85600.1 sigma 54-interacting transcriptional regulator [Cupriavidus oxalaticus]QRQ90312.1 sigma 54-interacting transcriptional regulator [Cupriavidus oxalaticus]WQD84824.1 sigma 54-interacting transcriptional regulator [Cupriavidus oxalaticus]SPC07721.1 Transcriptional regulatory protein XylR [Cupriavidus oxalaticus]SPC24447.1 Transcriptional regulatory protein XylR [Cupriavidus oxalaticus]
MTAPPKQPQFDLASLLTIDPKAAQIRLGDSRMVLMHTEALSYLRKEILDTLGLERGKGLLIRMGYAQGMRDAEMVKRERKDELETSPDDAFLLGPQLHMLEGVTRVDPVRLEIDRDTGHFYGEFLWQDSWEGEAPYNEELSREEGGCWVQLGYASGYSSTFMDRLVIYKETECQRRLDALCRIVGKPAEEWDDPEYLKYFEPDSVISDLLTLQQEVSTLRETLCGANQGNLIGQSPAFREAFGLLSAAADSHITVLLTGETGAGKEMFARWLHDHGPRAEQPFIAVNCAAIPHELIESELFGVEKGAYTGAQQSRPGRFERAHGGTLFLDEIGDLPLSAQVKLLRVLQNAEVERLGGVETRKIDVRLIAATNVNLAQAIRQGQFRADLFYRISTYPVAIPALRERREDIAELAQAFIQRFNACYQKQVRGLSQRAREALMQYQWPGNIRELENMIERGVLLAPAAGLIDTSHLFASQQGQAAEAPEDADALLQRLLDQQVSLPQIEARLMQLAIDTTRGNLSSAARMLGITRPQLAYRLKK